MTSATDQEIEIGSPIRLTHMLHIQICVTSARHDRSRRPPCLSTAYELFVAYLQLQLPRRHIELDHVAVLDECQRAPGGSFRADVQHGGAVGGAAHPGVGD